MRVACIVWEFPILLERFVLNQITGLICRRYDVGIYASVPNNVTKMHSNADKYCLLERAFYKSGVLANYFLAALKGFRLLFANFYRKSKLLLRSLNIFKYGKQAASLKLLYTVIPLLGKQLYDIIHYQFGTLSPLGLLLRNIVIPKATLITSFHGYDISQHIQE